jgi:hypothetical protein
VLLDPDGYVHIMKLTAMHGKSASLAVIIGFVSSVLACLLIGFFHRYLILKFWVKIKMKFLIT